MKNQMYYNLAKRKYVESSLQMLDHFKENVIEMHHIGSSSFTQLGMLEDIDILVILKTQNQVVELPEILIAEGYEIVDDFSSYYSNETVVRGLFEDAYVNFIFMSDGETRKFEILNCKISMNENNEYQRQFMKLKEQYKKSELDNKAYQFYKGKLFSNIINAHEDLNVI